MALRLWPEDFERRSRDGVGEDWPISYEDLEPYYDRVEWEMPLSGPRTMPWGPKRRAYPQPSHALCARDLLVARGMEQLGIRWVPTPLAILTGEHEGRSPCMNYGYCQWGCKSRAKGSMHVTYVPKAVAAGAEIRTGCRAVQLEVDGGGLVSGLVYVDGEGRSQRQEAGVYVLSAFCIETPRLLLHSATTRSPTGWPTRRAPSAATCWPASPTATSPASTTRSTPGPRRPAPSCHRSTTEPRTGASPAGQALATRLADHIAG